MSLTSLLNGTKPHQKDFQSILREIIPKKHHFHTVSGKDAFSAKHYENLVPYRLEKRDNASIIGIAFDYLARVMLARAVKDKSDAVYQNLTAEGGLKVLSGFLRNKPSIEKKITKRFNKSMKKYKAYSKNKRDISSLILDTCFLAKLERIYRSGLPPLNLYEKSFFDDPDDEVIQDLELLCNVFQENFIPIIKPTSEVIYNPHFGIAAAYVGGADGDVVIDGTLYDFKTSKQIGYRWQDVAQLTGYLLLQELSKDIHSKDRFKFLGTNYTSLNIERIAFYRARYGEIEYIETGNLDNREINSAKKELISYFLNNTPINRGTIASRNILEELSNNYLE